VTSGGFLESEAFRNLSLSLPIQHSGSCVISVLLRSRLAITYSFSHSVSFCFFRVSLSCFRRDLTGPSLNFALRMIHPHNPQSHQLTRNIIVLHHRASGPTAWPYFLFVVTPFVFFSVTFVRFRPSHSLLSIFAQIPVSRGAFPLFCKALLRK
jgi:hypothetical protein